MKITLQDLYNYIFRNDWANPEYSLSDKLTPEMRKKKIKARQARMKALFEEIIGPKDRESFRQTLRHFKATHLETAMFGNITDTLAGFNGVTNEMLSTPFDQFEQQGHYFSEPVTEESKSASAKPSSMKTKAFEKYCAYFHISKIVGDFIENNNQKDNVVACLHAYKLLVVFGDQDKPENYFKSIDKYLKQHNYLEANHPLHDALVWALPVNTPTVYISQWNKIIQETGMKAFQLFMRAADIGAKLLHPPKNYTEALMTARSITYKREAEDIELANLFILYDINDENFNKALDLMPKMKKADNLPTVVVRGEDIGHARYYLFKLPCDDKRAFVLGHITNCCQSIGGASEICVIDGITRVNNGFLVLVKERHHSTESKTEEKKSHPVLTESDINIKDILSRSKIVGQGYFWFSDLGNLTIDSWENLNPEAEDSIASDILRKYANTLVQQAGTNIVRVTIGTAGKTPEQLKGKEVKFAEKMLEGTAYGDAKKQCILGSDINFLSNLKVCSSEYENNKLLNFDLSYTFATKSALQIQPLMNCLKNAKYYQKFYEMLENNGSIVWNMFALLADRKVATAEVIKNILDLDRGARLSIHLAIGSLDKANILIPAALENFSAGEFNKKLYEREVPQSTGVYICFVLEILADSHALNLDTLQSLFSDYKIISLILDILRSLQQHQIPITEKIFSFLYAYRQDSTLAIKILSELTGKSVPNIYQHIEDKISQGESKSEAVATVTKPLSINYQKLLQGNPHFKINLVTDAMCTLFYYLGAPETIPIEDLLFNATKNGNIYLLNLFFEICPSKVSIETLFKKGRASDIYRLLIQEIYGNLSRYRDTSPGENDLVDKARADYTIFMFVAAKNGHLDVVNFYLNKGADKNLALKLAVIFELEDVVSLFLNEIKVDPNHSDLISIASHCRERTSKVNLIKILMAAGATLNESHTPNFAVKTYNFYLLKILLDKKVSVDDPSPEDGCNALANAVAYNDRKEMVIPLLEAKADVNFIIKNSAKSQQHSILHQAIFGHAPEIIEILVKHGARMEDLDERGRTVLQRAVNCVKGCFSYTQPEVIKKLLDLGANSDLSQHSDISKSTLYRSCASPSAKKVLEEFHAEAMKKNPPPVSYFAKVLTLFSGSKSTPEAEESKKVEAELLVPSKQT